MAGKTPPERSPRHSMTPCSNGFSNTATDNHMKRKIMNTLFLAIMTSLATLGSCTQVEDTLGDTDYPSKGVQGATYYLDSESGDDSQDGMSPETAWKTLGRLERSICRPAMRSCSVAVRRGTGSWLRGVRERSPPPSASVTTARAPARYQRLRRGGCRREALLEPVLLDHRGDRGYEPGSRARYLPMRHPY